MNPGNEGEGRGRAPLRARISSSPRRAAEFVARSTSARTWRVSNQTNRRLKIRGRDGSFLVLSPLERSSRVSGERLQTLGLPELAQQGYVALQVEPGPWMSRLAFIQSLMGKLSLLFFALWLYFFATAGTQGQRLFKGWLFLSLSLLVLSRIALALVTRQGGMDELRSSLVRRARQKIDALLFLMIGLGIPGFVIIMSDGFLDHLQAMVQPFQQPLASLLMNLAQVDHLHRITVAGRLLQLLLVAVLSLLPALLFYAFDREHQGTLRERFIAHIFRFDPAVKTRQDVQSRYGKQMDEAYGPERRDGVARLLPTRRSPLLVASLVLALGWTFTLLSVNEPRSSHDAAEFLSFFQPQPSALTFGFLGAYSYALLTVFRSYARRDLQPKIYSHITTRVFTVMVLAWVLEQSWRMFPNTSSDAQEFSPALLTLAFVTGIIPETGLVFIGEVLRNALRRVKKLAPVSNYQLVDPHEPLTSLEGIDIYDRARLQDEGVTNVQALARHDVVELMLQTRIPAPRLLDWVDQAILHLHAAGDEQTDDGTNTLLATLRRYGIRSVTDLLEANDRARQRGQQDAFFTLLTSAVPEGSISRSRILLDVIKDEEWVENLRYWHKPHPVQELEVDARTVSQVENASMRMLNPAA